MPYCEYCDTGMANFIHIGTSSTFSCDRFVWITTHTKLLAKNWLTWQISTKIITWITKCQQTRVVFIRNKLNLFFHFLLRSNLFEISSVWLVRHPCFNASNRQSANQDNNLVCNNGDAIVINTRGTPLAYKLFWFAREQCIVQHTVNMGRDNHKMVYNTYIQYVICRNV